MTERHFEELNQAKRRKRKVMWSLTASLMVLVAFGGLVVFVSKASMFKVDGVEIEGNRQVSRENVMAFLEGQIGEGFISKMIGESNFLVWPNVIEGEDLSLIPALKRVEIDKNFSEKKIFVKVIERKPYGIWCLEKKVPADCYWFDEEGILFKSAFSSEGNLIQVVKDYAHDDLKLRDVVLPEGFTPNLFSVLNVLENSGLSIKEVAVKDLSLEEVEATTFSNQKIHFSLRFKADGASEVLESLKKNNSLSTLNYIDFRVENRAYYR